MSEPQHGGESEARRMIEYIDDKGRKVHRYYRKPEPSYLKLHDETGRPWQVSVTIEGELRTTPLNIEDEYSEFTFGNFDAYIDIATRKESVAGEADAVGTGTE